MVLERFSSLDYLHPVVIKAEYYFSSQDLAGFSDGRSGVQSAYPLFLPEGFHRRYWQSWASLFYGALKSLRNKPIGWRRGGSLKIPRGKENDMQKDDPLRIAF